MLVNFCNKGISAFELEERHKNIPVSREAKEFSGGLANAHWVEIEEIMDVSEGGADAVVHRFPHEFQTPFGFAGKWVPFQNFCDVSMVTTQGFVYAYALFLSIFNQVFYPRTSFLSILRWRQWQQAWRCEECFASMRGVVRWWRWGIFIWKLNFIGGLLSHSTGRPWSVK